MQSNKTGKLYINLQNEEKKKFRTETQNERNEHFLRVGFARENFIQILRTQIYNKPDLKHSHLKTEECVCGGGGGR